MYDNGLPSSACLVVDSSVLDYELESCCGLLRRRSLLHPAVMKKLAVEMTD